LNPPAAARRRDSSSFRSASSRSPPTWSRSPRYPRLFARTRWSPVSRAIVRAASAQSRARGMWSEENVAQWLWASSASASPSPSRSRDARASASISSRSAIASEYHVSSNHTWLRRRWISISCRVTSRQLMEIHRRRSQVWLLLTWYSEAIADLEEMLALARASRDRLGEGEALAELAHSHWATFSSDHMPRARDCAEAALTIARETGDQRVLA